MKKWKPNISQLKNNLMNKSKSSEGKGISDRQMWKIAMKMYSGWKFEDAINDIVKSTKKPIITFDWFVKQFRKL